MVFIYHASLCFYVLYDFNNKMSDKLCMSSDIKDYELIKCIGKGAFGQAYLAKVSATGVDIAIKAIDKKFIVAKGYENRVAQEIKIHSQLRHPSILEFYHYFEDPDYVYIMLELCHNGEIQRHMKMNGRPFNEDETRRLMAQIVEGLLYLHKNNIIHRDLSLANLLLTENMDVKIADFGLSTQLREPDERHLTLCGTPNYISPEVATRSSHGLEADVWSLGCMFYTMLVGKPPFDMKGTKNTLNRVASAKFSIPSTLSVEATDLIKRLLCKNPQDRIKLTNIMKHPFMAKFNSKSLENSENILGLSGFMDSGVGTISTNSSRNSRPVLSHLPVLNESERSYERQRSPSVRSRNSVQRSGGNELLKSKIEQNKLLHEHLSRPKKLDRGEQYLRENDENVCPCSKSQCEHVHSNFSKHSCCSHESGHRACCENVKSNYKSPCCSHLSPCYDANKCSHVDECGCKKQREKHHTNEMTSKSEKTNGGDKQPLNTTRLKPRTHKIPNWNMRIMESLEVCVEYVKKKNGVEVVVDGCIISPDGLKMTVYSDNINRERIQFSFNEIPAKHWQKYSNAQRFVNVVKANTPKITFYTSESKNCLMENSPNSNFETTFVTGGKVSVTPLGTIIAEKDVKSYTVQSLGGIQYLSPAARKLWDHFYECHQHCLSIEKALTDILPDTSKSCFPCYIGHRPPGLKSSQQIQSPNTINLGPSAFGSLTSPSTMFTTPVLSKEIKTKMETSPTNLEIPNFGRAEKTPNNDVLIKYFDGSELRCNPSTVLIVYTDVTGKKRNIGPKDCLTKDIKRKFLPLPDVIRKLFPSK
uniref:Serine/threonine-protein kinase PLK4 n=1 Tax=Strigamia maritima TaxID=126957 RepID=T1JCE3_STRMM